MEKIKSFINFFIESEKGKDIIIVIIIILVGLISFELGRLSKENDQSGVKIEYPSQNNNNDTTQPENQAQVSVKNPERNLASIANKKFFASSKGSKYYSIGCSTGKSIKQENRIWYSTREEAEKAGYELSSSCR